MTGHQVTSFQMKNSSDQDRFYKFKNEISFLKESVDLSFLMTSLGFSIKKETSSELRASCIIHGGDNETSFRLNKKTRTWSCFSHACDEIHGKDIISLVRACRGCGFMEAVNFLKELTGFNNNFDNEDLIVYRRSKEKTEFISEFVEDESNVVHSKYLDERVLVANRFLRTDYFIKDGFSKETLDHFDISGGYVDDRGVKRDVIPIRDVDGAIVGCSFSSTIRETKYKDKYLFTPNLEKDKVLYNLNNALPYIEDKPVIIVEGFKGVWRLYEYGIKNVVACMGTYVTAGQKNLLITHSPKGAVLMFDNDGPGISGMVRSYSEIARKVKTQIVFITETDIYGKGLDPADLQKDSLYKYLEGYF